MYLRKINNKILIDFENEELTNRKKRLINSIVRGSYHGEYIEFEYSSDIFKDLIELFEQKSYKYRLDKKTNNLLKDLNKKTNEFITFSKRALEIKNNKNEASDLYVKFIQILDSNMKRKLYDFQSRASFHMAFSLNSCNFSVPGTGKTSIVYGAYTYLKHIKKVDKLLIVGPLSSFGPWMNEHYECYGYEAKIMNLSSENKSSKISYLNNHPSLQSEITFINYEGFSNIVKDMDFFIDSSNVMVVLDEAHKIKNPNSLRAKAVLNFTKKASSRIILTGTPLPNGYIDLYNLFEFIWPGKNITGFNPNSLSRITKSKNSMQLIKNLMINIDPYYIRIKKDYLGLPKPVFHKPKYVKMGRLQSEIYDFIAADFLNYEPDVNDYDLQFELKKGKLIRLMQAMTNPGAIDLHRDKYNNIEKGEMYQKISNYYKHEIPSKFIEVLKLVKEIIGRKEKVIVWTNYTFNVLELQKYIINNGFETKLLYGEINNEDRVEIIKQFHTDDNLKVIIANPAAVAESISLHKVCNNAIYMDKSFNASHYMQSKDRIHRVGLKPETIVNYYFLLSDNTIDEVIHDRVLKKEKRMLDVIEGNEVPLFDQDFGKDISIIDLDLIKKYLGAKHT